MTEHLVGVLLEESAELVLERGLREWAAIGGQSPTRKPPTWHWPRKTSLVVSLSARYSERA